MGLSAAPHFGREVEWAVLERALDETGAGRSRAGRSRAVGIVGEPGIGKSRLLGELGRRARAHGHVVVSERASELERDVPFALWTEALDGQLAGVGAEVLAASDEERFADLAVALPAVRQLAGVAPSGSGERHRVLHHRGPDSRAAVVGRRRARRVPPARCRGWRQASVRAASRSSRRVTTRRRAARCVTRIARGTDRPDRRAAPLFAHQGTTRTRRRSPSGWQRAPGHMSLS